MGGTLGSKGEKEQSIRRDQGRGRGRGGERWTSLARHGTAVYPGTTAGGSSTPALSPVPVDLQADCHLSLTHTHAHTPPCVYFNFASMRPQNKLLLLTLLSVSLF